MGSRGQLRVRETPAGVFEEDKARFARLPPAAQAKPNVDRAFARQLLAILRVALPSYRTREAAIVALHSVFLVLRTVLSVWVAKLDGRIVRDLVSRACPLVLWVFVLMHMGR